MSRTSFGFCLFLLLACSSIQLVISNKFTIGPFSLNIPNQKVFRNIKVTLESNSVNEKPFSVVLNIETKSIESKRGGIRTSGAKLTIPQGETIKITIQDETHKYYTLPSCRVAYLLTRVPNANVDKDPKTKQCPRSSGGRCSCSDLLTEEWRFADSGDTFGHITYGSRDFFKLQVSFDVTPVIDPKVTFSPEPVAGCPSYNLLRGSYMIFNIGDRRHGKTIKLFVGARSYDILDEQYKHTFHNAESVICRITSDGKDIWSLKVEVKSVKIWDIIDTNGGSNVATDKPFSLSLDGQCLLYNPEVPNWQIIYRGVIKEYHGKSFVHTFDKIGSNSDQAKMILVYPKGAKNTVYLQLYDEVKGLNVIANATAVCRGSTVHFQLSVEFGSTPSYQYNIQGKTLNPVKESFDTVVDHDNPVTYVFQARNAISVVSKKMTVDILNNNGPLSVVLPPKIYASVGAEVTIKPTSIKGIHCPYNYLWHINSNNVKKSSISDITKTPFLTRTFTSEAINDIIFILVQSSFRTQVFVENNISFSLPADFLATVNDTINIVPNLLSVSSVFSYKWTLIEDGSVTTPIDWVNGTSSVQPFRRRIKEERNFKLNLMVTNNVSSMNKTLIITVQRQRFVNFMISRKKCAIRTNQQPTQIPLRVTNTRTELNDTIVCQTDKQALPVIRTGGSENYSSNLSISFQQTGRVSLTCVLQGTQFEENFTFYVMDTLNAVISNTTVLAGETINGRVENRYAGVPYSWYIQEKNMQTKPTLIVDTYSFTGYKLTRPGYFVVSVIVDEGGEMGCLRSWDIKVNIPLTLTLNKQLVEDGIHLYKATSSTLNLSAFANVEGLSRIDYTWSNSKHQFTTKNNGYYSYFAMYQETFSIGVSVTINGVSASSIVTLHVQSRLENLDLVSQYGSHIARYIIVPYDATILDLQVAPVPANTHAVSVGMSCYLNSDTTNGFYHHTQGTKEPFQIPLKPNGSESKISGEVTCRLNASNDVSSFSKEIEFFVQSDKTPALVLENTTKYSGSQPVVLLSITNNTLPSKITWFYGDTDLTNCSSIVNVATHQIVKCRLTLNLEAADDLIVTLQSNSSFGYNVSKSITAIRNISVNPLVIQVSHSSPINIHADSSLVEFELRYDNNVTILRSLSHLIDVKDDRLGPHHLNITARNLISSVFYQQPISVIDAGDFGLDSSAGPVVNGALKVANGSAVSFTITNRSPHVQYKFNTTATLLEATDNSPPMTVLFVHPDESRVALGREQVQVEASLNGAVVKTETVLVSIYRPISDIQVRMPTVSLPFSTDYTLRITWAGEGGGCYIKRLVVTNCGDDSSRVSPSILLLANECQVTFKTDANYKCYAMQASVYNIAASEEVVWNYEPFSQVPVIIEAPLTEFSHEDSGLFSIKYPVPNTEYHWFLLYPNKATNTSLGAGKELNFTVPMNMTFGEYLIKVVATFEDIGGMGNLRKTNTVSILIQMDGENQLNSTLVVDQNSDKEYLSIMLGVSNHYVGLEYQWKVCWKSLRTRNCTRPSTVIGNSRSLLYILRKNESEGEYLFTVIGRGRHVIHEHPITISKQVIYLYCKAENLTITPLDHLNATSLHRMHTMSNWFYSQVKVDSHCKIKYKWSFRCQGNDHKDCRDSQLYNVTLLPGMQLIDDRALLELPPRAFQIGKYIMILSMELGFSYPTFIEKKIELTVSGTPLVPVISGGSYRVIGDENQAFLDATSTIDPDANYGTSEDLIYKWELPATNCYINPKDNSTVTAEWSPSYGRLEIRKGCLRVDPSQSYVHTVYVKREGRDDIVKTTQNVSHF